MKNKLLTFLLLLVTVAHSQTRQPFKNIGKSTQLVTLTNGKYDEFFDEDSIQRIGTALINIHTKKIVKMQLSQAEIDELENAKASRFLSVDPLTNKFPHLSPYEAFNANPILKNDPTGGSAEVTIDKDNKTITVKSHIVYYGREATALAQRSASDIQNAWNAANGKVHIQSGVDKKGKPIYETYSVKFNVTASLRTIDGIEDKVRSLFTGEKTLKEEIQSNKDYSLNYIRVEKNTSQNVSYMDGTGANTGVFKADNIEADGSTTEAHEYGHGLGLWPGTKDGHPPASNIVGQGQPGIMYARGTKVDPKYQYDPNASAGAAGGTINPEKRKVTQTDIDKLGLDKLKYDSNGKANLGNITNQYHAN